MCACIITTRIYMMLPTSSRFAASKLWVILVMSVGFSYIFFNYGRDDPKYFFTKLLHAMLKNVSQLKWMQQTTMPIKAEPRRILLWTPFFRGSTPEDYMLEENEESQKLVCKFQCEFTTNKDLLNSSHAVLFHGRDLETTRLEGRDTPTNVPAIRITSQQWIFYFFESASYTAAPLEAFDNFYNLTMTYRTDSDIYAPYRRLVKRTSGNQENKSSFSENFKRRNKLVAWVASNCQTPSHRELLVGEMQKYIPVDIFGACGNNSCPAKGPSQKSCYNQLSKSYKFYLSFENSLCKDYVTEKFFNALEAGLVPIVYGGANYSLHAPEGSYIDVNSFTSVKDLADYIKFLDRNHTEYLKYFAWRDQFQVDIASLLPRAWCTLCEKLTTGDLPSASVIQDLKSWWFVDANGSSVCSPPSILTQPQPTRDQSRTTGTTQKIV